MNYPQSQEILEKIKSANKVLLNCHQNPDADSVGSALAVAHAIKTFGKNVEIVCVDDIPPELKFLPNVETIQTTDFSTINYSQFDLFIILDTSSWDRVCGNKTLELPTLPIAIIDHHKSNLNYGQINLVDFKKSSNCEVLASVFEDWNVDVDKNLATYLLTGIIGDTGAFQFHVEPETLELGAKLIKLGANKDYITFNLYKNLEFQNIVVVGEILAKMQFDKDHKFIWSAIPYEFMKGYSDDLNLDVIDILMQSTKDTEFGVRMIEKEPNNLRISFRARTNFDTSKIAVELGGGGHAVASGVKIIDLPFDQAVEKVLQVARKYAKAN